MKTLLPTGAPCPTPLIDISLSGASVLGPPPGRLGDMVMLHIDDVGEIAGRIVRAAPDSFAVAFVDADEKPAFPRSWAKALAWQQESADLLVDGGFIKPIPAADLFDRRFETIAADSVPAAYRE